MRARFLALRSTGIQPTHLVAARATVDWDLSSPSTFGLIADDTRSLLSSRLFHSTRAHPLQRRRERGWDSGGVWARTSLRLRRGCWTSSLAVAASALVAAASCDSTRLDDGTCSTRRGPFQIVLCVCHNIIARVHLLVLLLLCPSSVRVSAATVARVHPLVLLILCSSYFVCLHHMCSCTSASPCSSATRCARRSLIWPAATKTER